MLTTIRRIRYKYAAAVVAGLALAGGVLPPSPASATSWWVGSWNVSHSSWCWNSGNYYCLFYSPNAQNGHWGSYAVGIPNLSGYVFSGSGTGVGAPVRNDAASMESVDCRTQTFVYPNYVGNSNEVGALRGGNLNSALRNNEASITLYCSG